MKPDPYADVWSISPCNSPVIIYALLALGFRSALVEWVDWIERAQDERGWFRPTSVFLEFRGWDFADKKAPSAWMTFLCCGILKRWYGWVDASGAMERWS